MFPARFSELTNFIAKYKEKVKKILTSFQARRIFWHLRYLNTPKLLRRICG